MDIKTLEEKVNLFLNDNKEKNFFDKNGKRLFSYISAGTQTGSHPVFKKITQIIDKHLTPLDIFKNKYSNYNDIEISVITFAFHYSNDIVNDNAAEVTHPSFSWYELRHKFDLILDPFILYIKSIFNDNKILIPEKSELYSVKKNTKVPTANWSLRHIAFACGLGSFGLHGALITDRGCTHRLLSIVTDYNFNHYPQISMNPYFNCLYFNNKSCTKCIDRCPVNAIIPGEHIIERCFDHEMVVNKHKAIEIYGKEIAACGLCMSGVPCDLKKPV